MQSATTSKVPPSLRQTNAQRRFNPKPRHIIVDLKWFGERIETTIEHYLGTASFVDYSVLADFIAGSPRAPLAPLQPAYAGGAGRGTTSDALSGGPRCFP